MRDHLNATEAGGAHDFQLFLAAEQDMAGRNVSDRFPRPLDELREIRVLHRTAAADKEEGAIDSEKLEYGLGVRVASDLRVGTQAKDDRVGLIEPSVNVKNGVGELTPKDFLNFVLPQPGHCLSVRRLLDQSVVIQRCQHSGQPGERVEDFAMFRQELADAIVEPAAIGPRRMGLQTLRDFFRSANEKVRLIALDLISQQLDVFFVGHRQHLFLRGAVATENTPAAFGSEKAQEVLEQEQGELSLQERLRCKIRSFSDGVILGSRSFVESHCQRLKQKIGYQPKSGPTALKIFGPAALWVFRNLRVRKFG